MFGPVDAFVASILHFRIMDEQTPPTSFKAVIDLWPTKAALARDLKAKGGATKTAPVREWYSRNSIPITWFDPLLAAAAERGFHELNYRLLAGFYRAPETTQAVPEPEPEAI